MFESYYQSELGYLRDIGRAFAEKHPALAGMLSERGSDPDVERLLEGFAFVAARIQQRIDDAAPELVESLAELLLPSVLRPTPASTIVEFRPAPKSLRGRVRLTRGARLMSRAVRGGRCTFTTAHDLTLAPLRLLGGRLDESSANRPTVTLRFEAESGAEPAIFNEQPIRLHLHGEPAISTQLYLWFTRHLAAVTFVAASGRSLELGPRAVRPVGFGVGEELFPWAEFAPHGPRLLSEYFTLPNKFLFFDLCVLREATAIASSTFEIVLRFDRPPPLPMRLPDDVFRLHCVPVVNVFAAGAEPIRAGLDERPTLLRAAGQNPLHNEVFAVSSVVGIARGAARHTYEAFHAFRHTDPHGAHASYYKVTRKASPVDEGTHTFLTLHRPPADVEDRGDETLSVELLCTNRKLPEELQIGDIATPTSDTPSGVAFSNIARVSAPRSPPLGSDLLWRFLAHLACTRRSLADRQVLVSHLALHASSEQRDYGQGRVHRARIEAIRSVRVDTITRVLRGIAARGSLYQLELDQTSFVSEGDAFLFGVVLHQLFSLDARINTYADLKVSLEPAGVEWRYDAELSR